MAGIGWGQAIISFGAIVSMTAVLLVFQMGQPRIFFSMSRDGLLPPVFRAVHPRFHTPHVTTIVTGIVVALGSTLLDDDETYDLTNIGTLFAFLVVCLGVLALRVRDPHRPRPFRVPFVWVVAPLGALACLFVMLGLPRTAWIRFGVWMALGIALYFAYGFRHSRLRDRAPARPDALRAPAGQRQQPLHAFLLEGILPLQVGPRVPPEGRLVVVGAAGEPRLAPGLDRPDPRLVGARVVGVGRREGAPRVAQAPPLRGRPGARGLEPPERTLAAPARTRRRRPSRPGAAEDATAAVGGAGARRAGARALAGAAKASAVARAGSSRTPLCAGASASFARDVALSAGAAGRASGTRAASDAASFSALFPAGSRLSAPAGPPGPRAAPRRAVRRTRAAARRGDGGASGVERASRSRFWSRSPSARPGRRGRRRRRGNGAGRRLAQRQRRHHREQQRGRRRPGPRRQPARPRAAPSTPRRAGPRRATGSASK